MRDGIYRVDFKPGYPNGYGIAMVRSGVFKGVDQDRVYFGEFTVREGRITGHIGFQQYLTRLQPSFGISGSTVNLEGRETENGFELTGESEVEPKSRYRIHGKRIADLSEPTR